MKVLVTFEAELSVATTLTKAQVIDLLQRKLIEATDLAVSVRSVLSDDDGGVLVHQRTAKVDLLAAGCENGNSH